MADRGPGQIIGVLAFDQVGPEALQRLANRAVAQHQPVVRAARHLGRRDGHGDRPVLFDDVVARPGTIIRCRCGVIVEDVPPLCRK